jgi:hypothetical protein
MNPGRLTTIVAGAASGLGAKIDPTDRAKLERVVAHPIDPINTSDTPEEVASELTPLRWIGDAVSHSAVRCASMSEWDRIGVHSIFRAAPLSGGCLVRPPSRPIDPEVRPHALGELPSAGGCRQKPSTDFTLGKRQVVTTSRYRRTGRKPDRSAKRSDPTENKNRFRNGTNQRLFRTGTARRVIRFHEPTLTPIGLPGKLSEAANPLRKHKPGLAMFSRLLVSRQLSLGPCFPCGNPVAENFSRPTRTHPSRARAL